MTPKVLLRIAAVLLAVFFLGHTLGGMVFGSSRGPAEDAVLAALGAYRFEIMGFTRSHADFYTGEGWYLSLALAVIIALTWQLSGRAAAQPGMVRALVVPIAIFATGSAVLCALYFFAAPLVCSALAALALFVAWWRLAAPQA